MTPTRCAAVLAACLAGAGPLISAQSSSSVRAFTGARLIDGTESAPIDNATIVVRDGRIAAVGAAASVTIPAGAERVALAGRTVIPGLINAHGHVNDVSRDLATYAAYGVTSVFSLGNDTTPEVFVAARDAQNTPALQRARIFTSGPVLAPKSVAEARDMVAKNAAMKVDIIKIRIDGTLDVKMPAAIYKAVIDQAHSRRLRVAVHIVTLEDARGALDAGADFIAHSVRDTPVDASFISSMKARDVCLSPTLMREVSTYVYESTPDFFSDPLFVKHADRRQVETLKDPVRQQAMRTSAAAQRGKTMLQMGSRNAKALLDGGVSLAMGTDSGPDGRFQGYFELMELERLRDAGLTPRQVLSAATTDAARCMKIDKDLGTLTPGKWADFVALNGDPLADISNVRKIDSVWIAGNRVPR